MRPRPEAPPPTAEHPSSDRRRRWRNERRRRRRPDLEIEVISWDGEGFDEDGWHRYALLACAYGTEEGPIIPGPELRRREGLSSMEMLDLVWRMGSAHPHAINVMYGAGYDWDHWIRDVDMETAKALRAAHPVRIGPWTVRYNGLWFEMSLGHGGRYQRVTVWDMYKFWGTTFIKALEGTLPDADGLDMMKRFKDLRGRFSWEMMDEVAQYNRYELVGLVRLTRQFFDDLGVAGVPAPSFLTGAGALAGALDRKYRVYQHVGDQHFGAGPIEDAVLRGYSAGRIEAWRCGYVPPFPSREPRVWQHDLISAYPTAMLHLPSMAEGEWEWCEALTPSADDRMSIWLVRWDFGEGRPYYPFFYRTRQGSILYPPAGAGWQWWPEVMMARDLGWDFRVIGGWRWRPAERLKEVRPYAWVPFVAAQRLKLKAEGKEGPQRVLKYGLNALYGKMAQSRGAPSSRPPANQNLAWAGWVTSYTRAQIMWAAHQAPESVLYQMTDSVVSLEPLDVPVGTFLGYWEVEERSAALVAQAGVGSTWDLDGKEHPKYRGFDEGSINAEAILDAWRFNRMAGWQHPLSCVVRRPMTLAQAVLSEENWADFGNWTDQPRDLNIYGGGGKRVAVGWDTWEPWLRTYPLTPCPAYVDGHGRPLTIDEIDVYCMEAGLDPLSAPYQPAWSEEDPWSLPEVMGRLRDQEWRAREFGA